MTYLHFRLFLMTIILFLLINSNFSPIGDSALAYVCTVNAAPVRIKVGQKINIARKQLIKNGWHPRISYPGSLDGGANALYEKGINEITGCGNGLAFCEYEYTDKNQNILKVRTQGEVWEKNPYPQISDFHIILHRYTVK